MTGSRSRRGHTVIIIGMFLPWVMLSGCGMGYQRGPAVPEALADATSIPGIPNARVWGDEPPSYTEAWLAAQPEELEQHYAGIMDTEHTYLAVSGGGADGAFGAGLLVGWTQAGTRPEFTMVTGVSTGALIAPFAFLGPEYDDMLTEIYISYSTKDMVKKRSLLKILQSDAATDSSPLRALIRRYYDEDIVEAVALEHRRGRDLLIATVNLDASRPVIWNMGFIADSGHPLAVKLFQDVIIASTAIPAIFPPIYIEVEAGGQTYQEMHVDGGAVQQMFLYPAGIDWDKVIQKLRVRGTPKLYMIRNCT